MAKRGNDRLSGICRLRLLVRRCLPRLLVLALLPQITGCAGTITRCSDGQKVELAEIGKELRGARLVLVGETHNNKSHHALQLKVIQALSANGKMLAIGAEMFAAVNQDKLDQWNQGRMDALTFQWLYEDNWSEPWALYRDIFLFARDNAIPIIGLNFPKALMHKVSTEGIPSLSDKEAALLPEGVACDVNSSYTQLIRMTYQTHVPKVGSFENFCTAQTLWNKGMARHLSNYLQEHPEITVVALVGVFHAIREAIPAEIHDTGCRVVVPELPEAVRISPAEADYVFR